MGAHALCHCDDPDALPAPVHIQTAERIAWMKGADAPPAFERYPPTD